MFIISNNKKKLQNLCSIEFDWPSWVLQVIVDCLLSPVILQTYGDKFCLAQYSNEPDCEPDQNNRDKK